MDGPCPVPHQRVRWVARQQTPPPKLACTGASLSQPLHTCHHLLAAPSELLHSSSTRAVSAQPLPAASTHMHPVLICVALATAQRCFSAATSSRPATRPGPEPAYPDAIRQQTSSTLAPAPQPASATARSPPSMLPQWSHNSTSFASRAVRPPAEVCQSQANGVGSHKLGAGACTWTRRPQQTRISCPPLLSTHLAAPSGPPQACPAAPQLGRHVVPPPAAPTHRVLPERIPPAEIAGKLRGGRPPPPCRPCC
jgi:hypothetical protein